MRFSTLLAIARVALLRSSWHSTSMRAALFIMRATNLSRVYFFFVDFAFRPSPTDKNRICTRQIQTAVSSYPLKIGHVYTNLFTRNSPYYHPLKYLLFLLKHPVCVCVCIYIYIYIYIYKILHSCVFRSSSSVCHFYPESTFHISTC